ncbi:FCD domain-containing protein [Paracoccus sp. TK19116]|uniref:FCD domain-containing protein n=1 Tax=Paracoccus albicereus TaxID=2922394 RepID=A0ABT1MQ21_9RHOB|nr:FCD domain-containing protein [Paracoccus albicereus]MCQ0969606.1 FCD domain-containing protein [Paracoccus albicereus]
MTESLESSGALVQLRAYLAQPDVGEGHRLPAERVLCGELGVTRPELRKALAVLESEGAIWRHVGKGTFVGTRALAPSEQPNSLYDISRRLSPHDVMEARLTLEPPLAAAAALSASSEQIAELQRITKASRAAKTWREYEALDNRFHRMIAEGTQNAALLCLFDQMNGLRRAVVWGRLRPDGVAPRPDHHSFAEHDAILTAIADRDCLQAEQRLRRHLLSVRAALFNRAALAESA